MNQVPWSKTTLEDFIKEGLLNEDEIFVIRTRLAGWSQVKQSMEMNVSTSTISNIMTRCRKKYDILHKQFPERFPKRRTSKIEKCLDDKYNDNTIHITCLCNSCNKDLSKMSALDLLKCYENCEYRKKL